MNEDPNANLTPWEIQQQIFDDGWEFWRNRFEATDRLEAFLAGQRYKNQANDFDEDRRSIQICGQETQDQVDHVVAKTTERRRSTEGKPQDAQGDAEMAEFMVALGDAELSDPIKGFDREEYMALKAARQGRRGVVWMDLCRDYGPFGAEIFWQFQQNGTVMWDPAYHPHHPLCGWLTRTKRVDYRQANRDYGVNWLRPDHANLQRTTNSFNGVPLASGYTDRIASQCIRDQRVTIRETWIKNDPTVDKSKPPTKREMGLKPADRYMQCAAGCGYRSNTQGMMKAQGLIRKALPETLPPASESDPMGGCPGIEENGIQMPCGAGLLRIDATEMSQAQLMYARGRRLIIVSPFCPSPDGNKALFDGSWPVPAVRSFPALFHFASVKPGDNSGGPGDVDRMFDQQMASDQLLTMGVQRIFERRTYYVMPQTGYYNANGDRFEFRDDDEIVIFRDMKKTREYGEAAITQVDGTGLDPEFNAVYSHAQNALRSFVNKADLAPNPEATRDIPVGSAQIQVQESEVATEDFIRRCNEARSIFRGCLDDYIRASYTPERIRRLNIEGADQLVRLWGDALPGFDYTVTEMRDFTGLDEAKAKAIPALMQAAQEATALGLDPIGMVELHGEANSIPPSMVRKFVKLMTEAQEKAAEAALTGQVPPGGAGGPLPGEGQPPGAAPDAMNVGPTAEAIPAEAAA
jgi:hypothetical protein